MESLRVSMLLCSVAAHSDMLIMFGSITLARSGCEFLRLQICIFHL